MIIQWIDEEDGEYNEAVARFPDGTEIAVFSDRDGEQWTCMINQDELITLEATDIYEARREALKHAGK